MTGGWGLFVFSVITWLSITDGKGVDLGLCSNENVVCACGTGGVQIHIPIKQCTFFYRWEPYCKACEKYDKGALCSQFRHCLSCHANKDGGCSACPVGRYGKHCQGVCQCQNGGICDRMNGNCECVTGYSGVFCDKAGHKTCGVAPTLRHGSVTGVTGVAAPKGSVAKYQCDAGYTLVGPAQRRCEKSGRWSGEEARCEYMCEVPKSQPNVKITVEPYVTMATADNPRGVKLVRRLKFACGAGYVINGLSELNCLATSRWNGAVPTCVKSCGTPPNVANGQFEGSRFMEGSKVNFYCNKGYMMTGSAFLACRAGQWTGTTPTCNLPASCSAPAFMGRVTPKAVTYTPGSRVTLSCNSGYSLEGASILTCQQGGQWNARIPKCVSTVTTASPSTCPTLNAPANGQILNSIRNSPAGQKVQFTCSGGFMLSGSAERTCRADGTWSGSQTRCIKVIVCVDPGTPKNGKQDVTDARARITGRGRGPGSRSRRPTSNRRNRISMADVSLPAGQFAVNTLLTFSCKPLYNLVGSKTRSCRTSGEWTGVQPSCVPVCGKSDGARALKIINGQVSKEGEYPWQAMLAHARNDGQFYGVCGATLVNENWVVTAAHCVTGQESTNLLPTSTIKIYLGKYYRDNKKDDQFVQEFTVSEIRLNPNYDPLLLDSDMALVRLSRPAKLSDRVMPICLPDNSPTGVTLFDKLISAGSFITVTGWGETENRIDAEVLLMTRLMTINNTQCEDKYAATNTPLVVTNNMFCAGHDDGRTDTCFGDSGGPAVAYTGGGKDRLWYLVGVVSWGSPLGCGEPLQFSGFTRVSMFLNYIYRNIDL